MPTSGSLLRGTSVVASLTLLSRVFGFVRDLLLARIFGAGSLSDCFFVAFRIPNLLRSFVAEGALTSAFVPVFSDSLSQGRSQAQSTLAVVTGFILFITCALSIAGIVFADFIVGIMAPGFLRDPQVFSLCVLLTRLMLPYIIFVSLVAMLNAALNTVQIFGAAAFAQVVMNLVLIAGALIAAAFTGAAAVKILAYSVVVGGAVQVLVQLPALSRSGFTLRPSFSLRNSAIRQLTVLMAPALVGASVYQLSQFLNTLFASILGMGSVSWLFYADRLSQLPIGIFSIALASVLLPALSTARAAGDDTKFSSSLINSLRYTSFFIIPVAAVLFIFAEPFIAWMFERGAFTSDDTAMTALAVQGFAIGAWGISCHSMISRAFIAGKDTVTPTVVGIFTLILNVFFALLFMGRLQSVESSALSQFAAALQAPLLQVFPSFNLQHAGLALASSLSSTISFLLMLAIFKRRSNQVQFGAFTSASVRAAAAVAIAIAADLTVKQYLPQAGAAQVSRLILFAMIYPAAARLMSSRELTESLQVIGALRSKIFRSSGG
ncbi:MAG: murein biosynthesis integral membrane protein MurJ [Deltaproteobacteria bacterium]|nr:murein biosynthesis integral membrane protein MurJ [Deltaproteobacteria bacterium]